MNKTLDYYMSLPYKVEIFPESNGRGYAARIPELPGCITCAESWDELRKMIENAKRSWLVCSIEHNDPIPEPAEKDSGISCG